MSDSTPSGVEGTEWAAGAWNGSRTVLQANDQVALPATPEGTVIVAAGNTSLSNPAEIALTSGGLPPQVISLPPSFDTVPWVEVANFRGNNLILTNISANVNTPVQVEVVGPGMTGVTPSSLQVDTPVTLGTAQSAQGNVPAGTFQFRIQSSTSVVAGVIGGPLDAQGLNGKVIGVNFPNDSAPAGYYAVTVANAYTLEVSGGTDRSS